MSEPTPGIRHCDGCYMRRPDYLFSDAAPVCIHCELKTAKDLLRKWVDGPVKAVQWRGLLRLTKLFLRVQL